MTRFGFFIGLEDLKTLLDLRRVGAGFFRVDQRDFQRLTFEAFDVIENRSLFEHFVDVVFLAEDAKVNEEGGEGNRDDGRFVFRPRSTTRTRVQFRPVEFRRSGAFERRRRRELNRFFF